MFAALGRGVHVHRRGVLAAALGLLVAAGIWGPGVTTAVKTGGFDVAGSESDRAQERLDETFGRTTADVVAVYSQDELTADDPAFVQAVQATVESLPSAQVSAVVTPWTHGGAPGAGSELVSPDGHTVLALVTLVGAEPHDLNRAFTAVRVDLAAPAPLTTQLGGTVVANAELQATSEQDIVRAEMLSFPVLALLLVLIFGSAVAAALPVAIGAIAILGAMALLRVVTTVTDVSTFALNVTTILGLGLAIDYALFMVSRFREELRAGDDVEAAVSRTLATAGRTVAFSGLTVLIAFSGLLLFPQMFLRSMGIGGMLVVLLDLVLALTLLPAVLGWLGHRVDRGRLPVAALGRLVRRRRPGFGTGAVAAAADVAAPEHGGWARLARVVLARPALFAAASVTVLLVLASPALHLHTGAGDVRDLSTASPAAIAQETVAEQFPHTAQTRIDVVLSGSADPGQAQDFAAELAALPGATGAQVLMADPAGAGAETGTTLIGVWTGDSVDATATRDLVRAARDLVPPAGSQSLVGGAAGASLDSVDAITDTLPATLGVVVGASLVLLFLALGSVVLPVKAVVMNALSLAATVGFLVWGFQDGHLAGLLGFVQTGRIDPSNIVLIAIIAFGLSMDYELFLLSRIREEFLLTGDQARSIAAGMQHSGRTVTSAALLLVVVLASMATSSVTFLKLIGLGLALAVALDATVVRGLLVPATMRLLGGANWWLPGPAHRGHDRISAR